LTEILRVLLKTIDLEQHSADDHFQVRNCAPRVTTDDQELLPIVQNLNFFIHWIRFFVGMWYTYISVKCIIMQCKPKVRVLLGKKPSFLLHSTPAKNETM